MSQAKTADDPRVERVIDRVEEVTAEQTARSYRSAIRKWARWCDRNGRAPIDADSLDVDSYLRYLKDEGYAHGTANVQQAGLAKFFECAQELADAGRIDADVPRENPTDNTSLTDVYTEKHERKTRKERALENIDGRHGLEPEEVDRLVNSVPSPTVRNQCIVRIMYQGMLRVQEVAKLKIGDVDRDARTITVRSEISKNGESRTVPYMSTLDRLLNLWWDVERNAHTQADESDYLFLSGQSERLTTQTIGDIVRKAAENAELQKPLYTDASGTERAKVTPHAIRHSGAVRRWSGDNGADLRTLQKALGHQDISTTETYLDVGDDDLDEKLRSTW